MKKALFNINHRKEGKLFKAFIVLVGSAPDLKEVIRLNFYYPQNTLYGVMWIGNEMAASVSCGGGGYNKLHAATYQIAAKLGIATSEGAPPEHQLIEVIRALHPNTPYQIIQINS